MHRRAFVQSATSCAAHIALLAGGNFAAARRAFAARPQGPVVVREPWGRLEEIGPRMWALVSTPLAGERGGPAWRTLSNGGIVAGGDDVLVIEAFASNEGARWLAEQARTLTGRWPTVGIVTHFHGDHVNGIAGYRGEDGTVDVRSTARTRALMGDAAALPAPTLPANGETILDLGGRTVRLTVRGGHTPSDVTIAVEDPPVVWCGDLVWNGMFPNYRDATPSRKAESVRALLAAGAARYVPGHGDLARRPDVERYLMLLDDVGEHARRAIERGDDLDAAAAAYTIPPALGEWVMFSPRYFRVAFEAWRREREAPGR